jgi:hypothetical protein
LHPPFEALIAVGKVRATYYANLVGLGWLFPATGLTVYSGQTDAILVAIAFSELPATIYTWWKLRARGVLSLRRELVVREERSFQARAG